MVYCDAEGDAAADRLERRWFAAFKAASAARGECEALLEEMERIETAWNHARVRLTEFEALRDALGEELLQLDGHQLDVARETADESEMSAA